MDNSQKKTVAALLDRYGTTYAAQAGIKLKDTPAPLYQLLVLSLLLSARIKADIAVDAARELFAADFATPRKMASATWQQRVDALGRGNYRRYDERTSTMLGDGAEQLLEQYRGDLRKLRSACDKRSALVTKLQEFPGIGPTGAAIFVREAQGIWPETAPFLDAKVADGADRLGLPTTAGKLAECVESEDLPRLAAACVRAALDKNVASEVRNAIA